jgi:hypothetical protein
VSGWAEIDPAAPHREGCPLSEDRRLHPGEECCCLDLAEWDEPPDPDPHDPDPRDDPLD